jgi:opacity protein-like surface antigen
MKKSFLAIALAMVAMVSSAQVYVGGSLGLNSTSQKISYDGNSQKSSYSTFNFAPEAGWIMDETWSFGAAINLATSDDDTQWSINPYARYTFHKAGNVSYFADAAIGFGVPEEKWTSLSFAVRPGIAVAITDKISVASTINLLGWHSNSYKEGKGKLAQSNIGFIDGASVRVYYTF